MYFYAQLSAGVCIAVTQSKAPLVGAHFIPLTSCDFSYLGRSYSQGQWL